MTVGSQKRIRRIIRKKVKEGGDFIKTVVPWSDALRRENNMDPATLEAIVREATHQGLSVAAHSMWTDGLETGIDSGLRSLEHAPPYVGGLIPDEVLGKARDRGVYFVPTADLLRRNYGIFNDRAALLEEPEYRRNMPEKSLRKMIAMADSVTAKLREKAEIRNAFEQLFHSYLPEYRENFRRTLDAGITIAAGTDSGANYTPHGILPRELELYVKLGMSPAEAIRSATMTGAELLGLEGEIGFLEAGKRADIVIVHGNPIQQISALRNVSLVMRDGQVLYRAEQSV